MSALNSSWLRLILVHTSVAQCASDGGYHIIMPLGRGPPPTPLTTTATWRGEGSFFEASRFRLGMARSKHTNGSQELCLLGQNTLIINYCPNKQVFLKIYIYSFLAFHLLLER